MHFLRIHKRVKAAGLPQVGSRSAVLCAFFKVTDGRVILEKCLENTINGPQGALRIGKDDSQIQSLSFDNRLHLETEQNDETCFYIVLMDQPVPNSKGKIELRPFCLILAKTMLEAIEAFEKENCGRTWLPEKYDDPFMHQIGIPRIATAGGREVRISKMRKDCIIGDSEYYRR